MRENVILIYFREYFGYLIKSVQLIVFIFQVKILTQFHTLTDRKSGTPLLFKNLSSRYVVALFQSVF
jgi:hypothetical protein